MYLTPYLATVARLMGVVFHFWLGEMLLLVVDNILRISAGVMLLSRSDVAFARSVVLLSLDASSGCAVGYV